MYVSEAILNIPNQTIHQMSTIKWPSFAPYRIDDPPSLAFLKFLTYKIMICNKIIIVLELLHHSG